MSFINLLFPVTLPPDYLIFLLPLGEGWDEGG